MVEIQQIFAERLSKTNCLVFLLCFSWISVYENHKLYVKSSFLLLLTPLLCFCPAGADAAEDEEVDVTSVDPIAAFCSR